MCYSDHSHFPNDSLVLFFYTPQNCERKKNRRFIALRCDVFICIMYQSDLLQFIKTLLVCTPEVSPKHRDRKRPLDSLPCRDKHASRVASFNPWEGFLLSMRLESVCVTQMVCMWWTRKYFLLLSQIEFRLSSQCQGVYCVIQWNSH